MGLDSGAKAVLWRRAFGDASFAEDARARDRLANALEDVCASASNLASEIARDFPGYTQHDATHFEAIWELASLIAGPDVILNPVEAFVFGAAVVMHDLAMSRSAAVFSGQDVKQRAEWPDALAIELRKLYGRAPTPTELSSPAESAAKTAEDNLLRALHAELALELPVACHASSDMGSIYIINDPDIRFACGRLIGEIAASHNWDQELAKNRFTSNVGAPSFAPLNWTVDTLVIAMLLRVADAAHLDAMRAPSILRAAREIPEESKIHWVFQEKLQRPQLENGRLLFTAPQGFARSEIDAWWLAYDTLQMVDEELRAADVLLSQARKQTFAARGVANVESPQSFGTVARCRDWEPVQAQVKVNDVAGLVRKLGGVELYGHDWSVGLRELLVNACDAVKARDAIYSYKGVRHHAGHVRVWLEPSDDGTWLCCQDNGIGMSAKILSNNLLDFGSSSWLSPDVARENAGLLASSFNPTGRFGIGFFSVFMMGTHVKVTSRPLHGAIGDTWVLEFGEGVERRPTLYRAGSREQLVEPGTIVKVLLDPSIAPLDEDKLQIFHDNGSIFYNQAVRFDKIVPFLLPTPEVDIYVGKEPAGGPEDLPLMSKNDWVTLGGAELLARLVISEDDDLSLEDIDSAEGDEALKDSESAGEYVERWPRHRTVSEHVNFYGPRLTLLQDITGSPVGRLCTLDSSDLGRYAGLFQNAIVTAGPARTATFVHSCAGILIGRPTRAARNSAVPVADAQATIKWSTSEAARVAQSYNQAGVWMSTIAEQILQLGGDPGDLKFWRTKAGWLSQSELVEWIEARESFAVAHPVYTFSQFGMARVDNDLLEGILYLEWGERSAIGTTRSGLYDDEEWPLSSSYFGENGQTGALVRAIAEAWGVDEAIVINAVEQTGRRHRLFPRPVAMHSGKHIIADVNLFDRGEMLGGLQRG